MSGRQLGTVGIIGVAFFVVTVVVFLFLDPGTSAVDLQASYYALGEYGWLMRVAFFALEIGTISIALGCAALSLLARGWRRRGF